MNTAPPKNPAETYERYFVPAMFQPWSTILLRHAALRKRERILDLACGTGIVARQAAPLVGESGQVVGLDINPAMLAVARALAAPAGAMIDWQQGNALALPAAEDTFDVVLCQHGLQFFPDRGCAVREMHRVLASDGRASIIVLQALAQHQVFEALMESVARHLALPLSDVMTPFILSDAEELRSLFAAAGFTRIDIHPESTIVRFPLDRFVPLAVTSSAAAVPAFAQLDEPAKAELLNAVREEVEPTLVLYRDAETISFPMFAHVVVARK